MNSESSPCSITLRLYSARRLSGALLISASQTSWHFEEIGPEGGGEGENGAGVVHIFVDELVVHAHLEPRTRIRRHQRRIGKNLVEIVEDERGFHDGGAVVNQRRH